MASRSVISASTRLVARREFVAAGAFLSQAESRSAAESMARKVGDTVEKAGEALRDTAKDSKEPAESDVRKNVRNAAEEVGDATAKAGDSIEHSMDDKTQGDDAAKSKLNKKNLEDKQVLSN